MAPKRRETIQGVLWVIFVLFQLTVLVQGQTSSTTDGATFNATIARIEGTRRFELRPIRASLFSVDLPANGTTRADAIVTLSPLGQADVDIFCFPSTSRDFVRVLQDGSRAPWSSNHSHGDDFVFISQHHPRYADALEEREDGDVVLVTCAIENYEARMVSVLVNIDLDYETIEMRQEDEEALDSIFTKCCQPEDSCKAWKEHRTNNDSVQSDLCHFHTNVCKSDGHLFRLSLENLNMECEFPYEEITQFKQLKKLLLKGNNFTGNTGKVLKELSKLPELEHIDISNSQLTGPLAGNGAMERSGICTFARGALLYLDLEGNNITGELPACLLYSSSTVKTIILASNKITGKLPAVSRFSSDLEELSLAGNQITGEIPASFAEGTSLEIMDLSRNQLTGSIPVEFGFFPSLRRLNLSHNKLSGTFPERLTDVLTLLILDLSNNSLTGELPDSIGDMEILVALFLGSNEFSGPLPSSLGNLSFLFQLNLSRNNFSGQIPESFRNLRNLWLLSLYNNSLTGSIRNVLPSSLLVLDLRDNHFSGAIPTSVSWAGLGDRPKSVQLSNNNFTSFDGEWYGGGVPMFRLGWFYAANNAIKGTFPPRLASAPYLRLLDLSNNDLSGPLPSEAGVFRSLLLLNLSSNAFTGPIPELWERSRLFNEEYNTTVDLSFNQLSGPIPDLFYEIPMNGEVNKTIVLEGNTFDVECPLPKSLSFIRGLVCNPDYAAPPIAEASLIAIEGDLPDSLFDIPAESSIEAPEASYIASSTNETMSTARHTSTTTAEDDNGRTESSTVSTLNEETAEVVEAQSLEGGSNKSNRNVLWIPAVVVVGFALFLALFLVIRRLSNARKAAASGGAAGGGKKPVPLVSLSTLESSKAIPPQREPSREDGVHMLTGVQSSAEI